MHWFILPLLALLLLLALVTATIVWRLHLPARKSYAWALARRLPTEPADLGLRSTDLEFTFSDGVRSPGWLVEGGRPEGPVLVVLHGWGDSRYEALKRVQPFLHTVRQAVLFDFRGHGESTGRTCRLGVTESRDVLEVIAQLPEPGPVALVGFSMGGQTAIAAAARAGELPADRPIVGVVADGASRDLVEPLRGYLRHRRMPTFPLVALVAAHLAFWLEPVRRFDRARHAAGVRCPLLLLHGGADPLCPVDSVRPIAAAARDARLVVFEDAGHMDLHERQPQRYAQVIGDFLAGLPGRTAGAASGAGPVARS